MTNNIEIRNRLIVSSLVLSKYIKECLINYSPENEDEITCCCENGNFEIPELHPESIWGEAFRNDWKVKISHTQLKRLNSFLKLLSEQPITLIFDPCGWIYIKEAII